MTQRRDDIDARAPEILNALRTDSYEKVALDFDTSRGKVYSIALRHGARKHELRISERAAERKRRQHDFLLDVLNATTKADVLDFLAGLPDGAVDLHLLSPPYNVGKRYGGGQGDQTSFCYYLGWMLQVCAELARSLREGGVLFLQVGSTRGPDGALYPIDCLLFPHLQQLGLTFNSRVVWTAAHGLTPRRRLAERYEVALVFSKGLAPRTFNATPVRRPQKEPDKRAFKGPRVGELSGHPYGAWPTNVWNDVGQVSNNRAERTGHPAQMPVKLAKRAILLYTNPGDLVVDCFVGSGTTAAAAIETGRAFTGADLFYEDERSKRLAQVVPDMVTPLPGVTDASLAVWAAEARPVHHAPRAATQLDLAYA